MLASSGLDFQPVGADSEGLRRFFCRQLRATRRLANKGWSAVLAEPSSIRRQPLAVMSVFGMVELVPSLTKTAPRGAKSDPRRPQEPPRAPQDLPRCNLMSGLGGYLGPTWRPEASRRPFWPPRGSMFAPPALHFERFRRFLRSPPATKRKRKPLARKNLISW